MKANTYLHNWESNEKNNTVTENILLAVTKASAEIHPKGTAVLKQSILGHLQDSGWSGEVEIDSASSISITSVKESTGLCFQTGNMARMYADLLKLQAVFAKGVVSRGVLIIPTRTCARILGSNVANFERLTRELRIFQSVITMPLLAVGVE